MSSDYRLSGPLIVRLLGAVVVAVGVALLLLAAAAALLHLPGTVVLVAVVLAAIVVGSLGLIATRGISVVRLDDTGYRVRLVRGAGVTQARWADVEDAVATTVAGERCIVLRLRDGRTTTVPVRMLAARPETFVGDLRARLDKGHGYRRIR